MSPDVQPGDGSEIGEARRQCRRIAEALENWAKGTRVPHLRRRRRSRRRFPWLRVDCVIRGERGSFLGSTRDGFQAPTVRNDPGSRRLRESTSWDGAGASPPHTSSDRTRSGAHGSLPGRSVIAVPLDRGTGARDALAIDTREAADRPFGSSVHDLVARDAKADRAACGLGDHLVGVRRRAGHDDTGRTGWLRGIPAISAVPPPTYRIVAACPPSATRPAGTGSWQTVVRDLGGQRDVVLERFETMLADRLSDASGLEFDQTGEHLVQRRGGRRSNASNWR